MNIDKRRKVECFAFDCKYAEMRCLAHYGSDCIKYGGNKIPIQRVLNDKSYPSQRPSLVKPKFENLKGWNMDELLRKEG